MVGRNSLSLRGVPLFLFMPNGLPVIVKLSPLKERAGLLPRNIPGMAHPKVPPEILLLPLYHPQHAGKPTLAPWCQARVQGRFVVPVRDVDPLVARHRVRLDGLGGSHTVLPLLLHLSVHDEQGVVRQMDRDLALCVSDGLVRVVGQDSPDAELTCNTEGEGADDGSRPEVSELVTVPADTLTGPVVAVYEGGVWVPGVGRLVLQLLGVGVAGCDAGCYLLVHRVLDSGFYLGEEGRDAADVLGAC